MKIAFSFLLLSSASAFLRLQLRPHLRSLPLRAVSATAESLATKWDFIDAVYLITTTLSSTTDRLEKTKEQLEKVGLLDKVKVKTFVPDDEDRVRGCYTSHIKVITEIDKQLGRKKDYKVLILEDNLEATGGMRPEILDSIQDFLVAPQREWDVFHLAYMMYVPGLSLSKLPEKNIVRMTATQQAAVGTSAYLISKSGVKSMLEDYRQNSYTEAVPNILAKYNSLSLSLYIYIYIYIYICVCIYKCKHIHLFLGCFHPPVLLLTLWSFIAQRRLVHL